MLLAQLLRHPWLVEAHAEEISEMPLWSPELANLRDAILSTTTVEPEIGADRLSETLRAAGHHHAVDRLENKIADAQESERMTTEADWLADLACHRRASSLKQELREAQQDWVTHGTDAAFERIKTAKHAIDAHHREGQKT